MKHVIVTYTVKAGRAEENAALVQAVFAELHEAEPDRFAYATYRDGGSFTHVASYEGDSALTELEQFKEFRAGLRDRCAIPPVLREVEQVGAYNAAIASRPATVG